MSDLRSMGPGPILGISTGSKRRDSINVQTLNRCKIPVEHRNATLEKIHDPGLRKIVSNFLSQIMVLLNEGAGLTLSGDVGRGKTAIATMIAMESMRWGRSAQFVTHQELQELEFRDTVGVSDGQSRRSDLSRIDLLVIDGLDEGYAVDSKFGPQQLEGLIKRRNGAVKSTIITTRLTGPQFCVGIPALKSVMSGSMVALNVTGPDLRADRNQRLKSLIGMESK